MTVFPIPKQTGTHADTFAAVGLAELLSRCHISVRLDDTGAEYRVVADEEVTESHLRRVGNDPGYLYLVPNEKERAKTPAAIGDRYFDYPREKERFDLWKEAAAQRKGASSETAEEIEGQKPDSLFQHYRVLNLVQGDGPLNKAAAEIRKLDPADWTPRVYSSLQALAERRTASIGFDTELVQMFSPLAAKGYARLKPDSTGRGDKTKDAWADSFLDWLRFQGFFSASIGFLLGKDIRVLTVEPKRIGYGYFAAVMTALRDVRLGGANVRVDCLGTLGVARALVAHAVDHPDEYGEPAELVGGIAITHYQSLGSAKAVTGLSRLCVPGWYPLRSAEDAANWIEALDEHERCLRRLDDSISDELQLLVLYRRHLEHRGPGTEFRLAEFLEGYGIYLIRKRGQDDWRFRQFSLPIFEAIMATYGSYSDILNNRGFQAVALALRASTVSAQSMKRNKRDFREIRYDILPELRRKRSLPKSDEFLDALADFVASYNAESAKRLEQGKGTGIARVADDDFAAFVSLIERDRSPAVVGALLCAYATCKAGQEADGDKSPDSTKED
ncbi:MAG: hypothetical protein SFV18_15375 [Bryobacteraceae bacterium]|nr:hypothetical protein [Bryobacteraceae bacterium]